MLPPPPLLYDAINFYTSDNFAEARFNNSKVFHCGRPGATKQGRDLQRWSFTLPVEEPVAKREAQSAGDSPPLI